ncbi:zinc finger MYM-type protein 4 isoform X2 [Sardina pilchardus]|uniref:zinc finger MYM-type protein 4 isoform X2 n=1 Tax=Sardina pilchardus TaxID=27697 RepID=UPI002E0D2874
MDEIESLKTDEQSSGNGEAKGLCTPDSGETTSRDDANGDSASGELINADSSKGDTGHIETPSGDDSNKSESPKGESVDSRTGGVDGVDAVNTSAGDANGDSATPDTGNSSSGVMSSDTGNPSSGVMSSDTEDPSSGVTSSDTGNPSSEVTSSDTGNPSSGVTSSDTGNPSSGVTSSDTGNPSSGVMSSDTGNPSSGVTSSSQTGDSTMTEEAASESTPPEPQSHPPPTELKAVAGAEEHGPEEMETEAMEVVEGKQDTPGQGSEGDAEEGRKEETKAVLDEERPKGIVEVSGESGSRGAAESLDGGDMEVDGQSEDSVSGVLEVPVISEIKEEISMDSEGDTADLDMGVDMEMTEGLDMGVETIDTSQSEASSERPVGHGIKLTSVATETDTDDLDMGVETVMEDSADSLSDGKDKTKKADSGLKQELDNPDASRNSTDSLETPALANRETSALDSASQDSLPAAELNLCIKDEPQDEEYDRALAPFNTEGIKDEPEEFGQQKLSDEFKISAVFSVGQTPVVTAAKAAAPVPVAPVKAAVPALASLGQPPAASSVCVVCSGCQKVLLKGQTAYQRKGSPQLYCSTICLTGSTGTFIKPSKRTCHFCIKTIPNPKDVIIAPVDKVGSMKDFCSQKCLSTFNFKLDKVLGTLTTSKSASSALTLAAQVVSATQVAPTSTVEGKARCSSCQKVVVTKHEVSYMGAVHKLCSDECFTHFRSSNKLNMNCCAHCGSYCYQTGQGHTLQIDNVSKKFCSQTCITAYRKKSLTSVPCAMCKAMRTSSDMIEGVDSKGKTELFCSATCVTAHRVHTVSSAGTSLPCNKCGTTAVPQYHLAMSDGSIRNFCTFNCVVSFQDNFNKTNAQKMNVAPAKVDAVPSTSAPEPSASPPQAAPSVKLGKLFCRQCNRTITTKPETVEVKGRMFVLCGKTCVEDFRRASQLPGRCDYCKADKGVKDVKRVCGVDRLFCSEGCTLLYRHDLAKRWGRKHCRNCRYCAGISPTVITSSFSGKPEEFCSQECVSAYTLLFCQVAKCASCQRARSMSDSLRWLGEIKHFCNLQCVLYFCNLNGSREPLSKVMSATSTPPAQKPPVSKEATPIIANVISLSSTPNGQPSVLANPTLQGAVPNMPVKSTGVASTQTDVVKAPPPPPPKVLKNKSLLCKPLTQTKGTLCKPTHETIETQTEQRYPHVLVVPIPVPVYVPVPMHLYSQYAPQPLGLPLPVPVPMFLPTTLDSAERIVETIQQIKEKIPTDPLEADLILMAELVAEDDQKDKNDTPVASISPDNVPDSSPPAIPDFDLDALGWDDDLLSAQPSDSPTPFLDPTPPEPPEENIDLEADFSIEALETASERESEHPEPPPSKRPRRRVRDGFPQKKRSSRKRPTVEPPALPLPAGKLHAVYGVKAWKKWVQWRKTQPDVPMPRFGSRPIVLKEDLLQCSTAELSYGLCKFISEARRPGGEEYSPDSIYYLCLGIQQHLFENGRMENIFADLFYNKFTQEITKQLKDWTPVVTPGGYIHSRVEEEYLWECKQLGAYSPSVLLYTLFYFCTKFFGLRSVQQHQRLSFAHVMRCTRPHKSSKAACLRFYPPINRKESPKGTDGEEASGKRKKEDEEDELVLEMQENTENPLRCPVRIYEFYLSKCSPSVKQRTNAFYLQPERCCVPNSPMWFSSAPLDGDGLQAMLTRILTVRELHLPQEPKPQQTASSDEQDSD